MDPVCPKRSDPDPRSGPNQTRFPTLDKGPLRVRRAVERQRAVEGTEGSKEDKEQQRGQRA
jgi:hypothetical protein